MPSKYDADFNIFIAFITKSFLLEKLVAFMFILALPKLLFCIIFTHKET